MHIYKVIFVVMFTGSTTWALPQSQPVSGSPAAENSSGAVVGGTTSAISQAPGLPATTAEPAVAASAVASPQVASPASVATTAATNAAAVSTQSSQAASPVVGAAIGVSSSSDNTTAAQGSECSNQQSTSGASAASGASTGSAAATTPRDSGAAIGNAGAGGPKITLKNPTSSSHSYVISTGANSQPGNFGMAGGSPAPDSSHPVPPNGDIVFYPGIGWAGSITQQVDGKDGSRHEFTHDMKTGKMSYDTDQEFGLSNSVLAPVGGPAKLADGTDPESGEKDWAAKINAAWGSWSGDKQSMLNNPGCKNYLSGTTQSLTHYAMDKGAPATCQVWVDFLQLQVKPQSYVDKGAVAGQSETSTGRAADGQTKTRRIERYEAGPNI